MSRTAWLTQGQLKIVWRTTWILYVIGVFTSIYNTIEIVRGESTLDILLWLGLIFGLGAFLCFVFFGAFCLVIILVKAFKRLGDRDVMRTEMMEQDYNKMKERNKNW